MWLKSFCKVLSKSRVTLTVRWRTRWGASREFAFLLWLHFQSLISVFSPVFMTEELTGKTKFDKIISPRFICENVTFYSRVREKKNISQEKKSCKTEWFYFLFLLDLEKKMFRGEMEREVLAGEFIFCTFVCVILILTTRRWSAVKMSKSVHVLF